MKKCPCGKTLTSTGARLSRSKYCSKVCFYKFRVRPSGLHYVFVKENLGRFRKGRPSPRKFTSVAHVEGGYVVMWYDGQRIKLHHLLVGRKLKKNEVVHHINGVKTDNRPENLRIMTRSQHTALHHKQRRKGHGKKN